MCMFVHMPIYGAYNTFPKHHEYHIMPLCEQHRSDRRIPACLALANVLSKAPLMTRAGVCVCVLDARSRGPQWGVTQGGGLRWRKWKGGMDDVA